MPVVANRKHGESYACASACARALVELKQGGTLVVDDKDRILAEYRSNLSMSGQPGVGDSFVKWAHDNLGRRELIVRVTITPRPNGIEDYHEFPNTAELTRFDPADRKFVAACNAHPERPPILQAMDSKWWGFKNALEACGITVDFLCPVEIEQVYQRKMESS